MEEAVKEASAKGVSVTGLVRLGAPAPTLLAAAEELRAGEIVIGHKSYEGPAFTLGPNADAIVRGSKVPVTVVP
jgi:nucleotide-binding universal stress UspA family protein